MPAGQRFQPGVSGNPTGRPKKTQEEYDLEAACRAKSPEAVKRIVELMEDADKDSVSLGAACYLIDRGYGKPRQPTEAKPNEFDEMPTALLLELRAVAEERILQLSVADGGDVHHDNGKKVTTKQ